MKPPQISFRTSRAARHEPNRGLLLLIGFAFLPISVSACSSDSDMGSRNGIGIQPGASVSPGSSSDSSTQIIGSQDSEEDLPRGWIRLWFEGADYVCEEVGYSDADCVRAFGSVPSYIGTPDQYCSNVMSSFPDCSDLWYPSELDDYTFIQYGPSDYVCEDSFSGFAFGDAECFRYSGGDPGMATGAFPDLYCSDSFSAIPTCDEDYFPSELEGLEFVTIDGSDYVCEDTFGGLECFRWRGFGSPRDAIGFSPDFYCNDWGECAEDDFP